MIEWKYVIPIVTAIAGLIGGHFFTNRRESLKRKKEMRIEYLVNAYRKLEKGASPTSADYSAGEFESAISDIQLFGSGEQVILAHRFCEAASKGDGSLLQELLENIRKELREELEVKNSNLPPVRPFRVPTANKRVN